MKINITAAQKEKIHKYVRLRAQLKYMLDNLLSTQYPELIQQIITGIIEGYNDDEEYQQGGRRRSRRSRRTRRARSTHRKSSKKSRKHRR